MARFVYKARDADGKLVRGSLEAKTRDEAIGTLRERGLRVTSIQPAAKSTFSLLSASTQSKPMKSKTLAVLARQLAIQLEAGVSIIASLQLLEEQSQDKRLAKALNTMRLDIASGSSLTNAINKHRSVFPHEFIHLVEAGEVAGELPAVLNQLATYYERTDELHKKVSQALMYPMLIGIVAVIVILGLIYFILPMLIANFTSFGVKPPRMTQMVLDFRKATIDNWYWILGGLAAVVSGCTFYFRTEHGRLIRDRIKLKLPITGNLSQMVIFSRFCRVMAVLLKSGISMVRALRIAERLIDNRIVVMAIRDARLAVEKGQGLTEPLRRRSVFPKMLVQMVAVGEETGNLEKTLVHLSNFYDNEVSYAVTSFTKILEPLVMLLLAIVVGFIVVSVYLPMMQMMTDIRF